MINRPLVGGAIRLPMPIEMFIVPGCLPDAICDDLTALAVNAREQST